MNIEEIKIKFKLSNHDIAQMFGYKNTHSYITSSAKPRIEKGVAEIINYLFDDTKRLPDN